jgi:hypothetical protein
MHFETVLHSIHPYLPTTMAVDSCGFMFVALQEKEIHRQIYFDEYSINSSVN